MYKKQRYETGLAFADLPRYNELLFVVDTCQGATLTKQFYTPNIVAIGSSRYGENSYSHGVDKEIGLSLMDRFSFYSMEFFANHLDPTSNTR